MSSAAALLMAIGQSSIYHAETLVWEAGIVGAGGSVTTQEKDWADALIRAIIAKSYGSKIKYLLPFLGTNIKAHRMPLRDSFSVGMATLRGASPFVDADCTNNGIDNPTEKDAQLDTLVPINWNAANGHIMGLGWYERNIGLGSGVEPCGAYNSGASKRFVLDLRSSLRYVRFGNPSLNLSGTTSAAVSGDYYGQNTTGNVLQLYRDGSTDGAAGTGDSSLIDSSTIYAMGVNAPPVNTWKGRGGCFLITDGTISGSDVSDLHTLIGTYLITPTGR